MSCTCFANLHKLAEQPYHVYRHIKILSKNIYTIILSDFAGKQLVNCCGSVGFIGWNCMHMVDTLQASSLQQITVHIIHSYSHSMHGHLYVIPYTIKHSFEKTFMVFANHEYLPLNIFLLCNQYTKIGNHGKTVNVSLHNE